MATFSFVLQFHSLYLKLPKLPSNYARSILLLMES